VVRSLLGGTEHRCFSSRNESLYGTDGVGIRLLTLPTQPLLVLHDSLVTHLLSGSLSRRSSSADGCDTGNQAPAQRAYRAC
jgi:hypothetical protein